MELFNSLLEVYTGDGSTVYFRAMRDYTAFFVSSETTHYAVMLHRGSDSTGTMYGPGPYRQSWWNVQFGYVDGQFVYRHWPVGEDAPAYLVEDVNPDGLVGHLQIEAYSANESVMIRNLQVEGLGTVASEIISWGKLKDSFR